MREKAESEKERKINWRERYKNAVRREFRWAMLSYGLACLVVIEAVLIYMFIVTAK